MNKIVAFLFLFPLIAFGQVTSQLGGVTGGGSSGTSALDADAVALATRFGATNDYAKSQINNFVLTLKENSLWGRMLDGQTLRKLHLPNATVKFPTFRSYFTQFTDCTMTLDNNGMLFTGAGAIPGYRCATSTTNYTLAMDFKAHTNMTSGAQVIVLGMQTTSGWQGGGADFQYNSSAGTDFMKVWSMRTNFVSADNMTFVGNSNAPSLHMFDGLRHSAMFATDGLTAWTNWVDGLYYTNVTGKLGPTNHMMTDLSVGGYSVFGPSFTSAGYKGYISAWLMFSGTLTDTEAKAVELAFRCLAPQTINLVVEGDSRSAWYGGVLEPEKLGNWPFLLSQMPGMSNNFFFYNHAKGGARQTLATSGFGNISNEYANTIQYLRPGRYGGARNVDRSVLLLDTGFNDFVSVVSAATVYNSVLGYVNAAAADGFEVYVTEIGAGHFVNGASETARQLYNRMLSTNVGMGVKLIQRDLLFPPNTTNTSLFSGTAGDFTHYSETGHLAAASQVWRAFASGEPTVLLSTTTNLDFASLTGPATQVLPVYLLGTSAGDTVKVAGPTPGAGCQYGGFTSNNYVYVSHLNSTLIAVDPAAANFTVTVEKVRP